MFGLSAATFGIASASSSSPTTARCCASTHDDTVVLRSACASSATATVMEIRTWGIVHCPLTGDQEVRRSGGHSVRRRIRGAVAGGHRPIEFQQQEKVPPVLLISCKETSVHSPFRTEIRTWALFAVLLQ